MERHDTHVLSNSSSSNNHSYELDNKNNKNKNAKKIILRNTQGNTNDEHLTDIQKKKVNSILNKYNITIEQYLKNEELYKHNQKTENNKEKEININQNILNKGKKKEKKKKNESPKIDIIYAKNTIKSEEIKKEEPKLEENPKEEEEENKKGEIQKEQNNDIYLKGIKYENKEKENKMVKDKEKFSISYKNNLRDTRFNNIQKNLDDENRRKLKIKKIEDKNKLLIYQKVDKLGNLLREIKKPTISFITKIFKDKYQILENINGKDEIIPGILLSVKNSCSFYTKEFVKNKVYNRKIKILKYQKNKEEINDEKIPTFSSINTSSSNSDFKTKSKSKSKKKQQKNKTKIKPKNFGKKKNTLYSKNARPQRSISVYSKVSKEKSDEGKKSLSKKKKLIIPNVKKRQPYVSERKMVGVNKNIRKYSIVNRNKVKNNNLQKDTDKMDESGKINLNEKEPNEIDFKKFLEQQRLKRNKQIKNFIKKQGINSYNFFYPKEPSPLLSTFKNKYNIYPTLNVDRKNSVDIGMNNDIIINKRQFYRIKNNPKKIKTFYDKENYINGENKESSIHNNLHLIGKHYGLEKDCPLCRAFQMKKLKDKYNTINYIKSMKYKKIKGNENQQKIFNPNSFWLINGSEREYSSLSRNRNSSAKKSDYIDEYSQIRKNFVVLFDYFN